MILVSSVCTLVQGSEISNSFGVQIWYWGTVGWFDNDVLIDSITIYNRDIVVESWLVH